MLLPDFCGACSTDHAGNYNLICFQDLTEIQLRHWHSWVLGKRQGQRNSSYLKTFAKGGEKRNLTVCKGLSFVEKAHCTGSVCRKAEVGQRHLTNWLAKETEPWKAEPCSAPSLPLNIIKAWCITKNVLVFSEVQQLRKNPVHFFLFLHGFMPCTKYESKLHILKAFY